jgi:hypothetical protein
LSCRQGGEERADLHRNAENRLEPGAGKVMSGLPGWK